MIDVVPPSAEQFEKAVLVPKSRINDPNTKLKRPSLSAILGSSDDKKGLYLWQKQMIEEMGLAGFRKSMNDRMQEGIKIHERVKAMLDARKNSVEKNLKCIIDAEKNKVISNYLQSVYNFIAEKLEEPENSLSEKAVRHPLLAYQGRFDAVIKYKNDWHMVDWKTSPARSSFSQQKEESLSYATYSRQLAAYAAAFNQDAAFEGHPQVRKALLISLKEDGSEAEVYELSEDELQYHFDEVKKSLLRFWHVVANAKSANIDFAYKPT
ncbi:unnamed protein product [Caenorhabditis bovis]|uniref:PD-(D/E)XK endonuclease-like domain-containing protein n=1 Tax=Caenorhabditis bovis TaxID=2654633 RepID=A0A8S1ECV2_9PELO|nr:unnamed protein product [Caenorhabditis bovis]